MPNENPTKQCRCQSHGVFPRLELGNCVCFTLLGLFALGLFLTFLNSKVYFSCSWKVYLCNTTFSAFSSSPSDAEFDAVVGYLEDIIMGKLSKQTTRWVLKMLHTQPIYPLPARGSSLSFLLVITAVKKNVQGSILYSVCTTAVCYVAELAGSKNVQWSQSCTMRGSRELSA